MGTHRGHVDKTRRTNLLVFAHLGRCIDGHSRTALSASEQKADHPKCGGGPAVRRWGAGHRAVRSGVQRPGSDDPSAAKASLQFGRSLRGQRCVHQSAIGRLPLERRIAQGPVEPMVLHAGIRGQPDVVPAARPRIVLRPLDVPDRYRPCLDVAQRIEEGGVGFQDRRAVATSEQRSGTAPTVVDPRT